MKITTSQLIEQYNEVHTRMIQLEEQRVAIRNKIARRIRVRESDDNWSVTPYRVESTVVRKHTRSGYRAIRITTRT